MWVCKAGLALLLVMCCVAHSSLGQTEQPWEQWAIRLNHNHSDIRARAALELSRFGAEAEPALDALLLCLEDREPNVRLNAAQTIGSMACRAKDCVPDLVPCLEDESEHVRYAAEWALARLALVPVPFSEAEQRLQDFQAAIEMMQQRDHSLRHRLVLEDAVEKLRDLIESQTSHTRTALPIAQEPSNQASLAPGHLVQAPVPQAPPWALPPPPTPKTDDLRERGLLASQSGGDSVGPPAGFMKSFEQKDSLEQYWCIDQLTPSGDERSEEGPLRRREVMTAILQKQDRAKIAYAIYRWGPAGRLAVREIFAAFSSREKLPRWTTGMLEHYEPEDEWDVAKLIQVAENSRNETLVRGQAIQTLGRSFAFQGQAVPVLLRLAQDDYEDLAFRQLCVEELGELCQGSTPSQALEDQLAQTLASSSQPWGLRLACAESLAKINPLSHNAEQELLNSIPLGETSTLPKMHAVIESLSGFMSPCPRSLEVLKEAIAAEDIETRMAAAVAVERLGPPAIDVLPHLLERFDASEEQPVVLVAIAKAISSLGDSCIEALGTRIIELDEEKQRDALLALAELGGEASASLSTCIRIVENPALGIKTRTAAIMVLSQIGAEARSAETTLRQFTASTNDPAAMQIAQIALAKLGALTQADLLRLAPTDVASDASRAAVRFWAGEREAADQLVAALRSEEYELASDALLDIGEPVASSLVKALADTQAGPQLRRRAAETLARLPHSSYQLLNYVDDPVVGATCVDALGRARHDSITEEFMQHVVQASYQVQRSQAREGLQKVLDGTSLFGDGAASLDSEFSGAEGSPTRLMQRLFSEIGEGIPSTEMRTSVAQQASVGTISTAAPDFAAAKAMETASASAALPFATSEIQAEANEHVNLQPFTTPNTLLSAEAIADRLEEKVRQGGSEVRQGNSTVSVFFGTNRTPVSGIDAQKGAEDLQKLAALTGALAIIGLWIVGVMKRQVVLYSCFAVAGGILVANLWGLESLQVHVKTVNATAFGNELDDQLRLGVCEVSIPKSHRTGELEGAEIFKLQFRKDPNKHILLSKTEPLDQADFFRTMAGEMDSKGKNLLVFVHGYNVSFEDAARRTAQMSFDLKFPGAAAFFSWPSQDNWYEYQKDRKNIQLSVAPMKQFLLDLAERSGAEQIHLVAHSMGNVGLTEALVEMGDLQPPLFNQVVLAAPDIDADVFKQRIAPRLVTKAQRVTVYTSKTDLALLASRYFNAGRRAGEMAGEVLYQGIDVIDASAVDTSLLGHSYYGKSSVLSDLSELLSNRDLQQRTFVKTATVDGVPYRYVDGGFLASDPSVDPMLR